MEKNLYEKDYYLWLDKTINLLENHQFSDLDLENLISSGLIPRRSRRIIEK